MGTEEPGNPWIYVWSYNMISFNTITLYAFADNDKETFSTFELITFPFRLALNIIYIEILGDFFFYFFAISHSPGNHIKTQIHAPCTT